MFKYAILDRSTPYHLPHSTEMMGCSLVFSGDDRYYNNIFLNTQEAPNRKFRVGLSMFDGAPDSLQEYIDTVWARFGKSDATEFLQVKQPLYTAHNYYGDGVPPYERDRTSVKTDAPSRARIVTEENGDVYLEMTLDGAFDSLTAERVDTARLDMTRISEALYENPDGSPITVDTDLFGHPRGVNPTPGPIENIGAGNIRILLVKG